MLLTRVKTSPGNSHDNEFLPPRTVLGTQQEDVEDLVEKLSELVPVMSSTMCLRQDFREETHQHSPSLIYMEELSWPGLGAVR